MTVTRRGISNILIRLTDGDGHTRFAETSTFGYYRFAEVNAGENYIITAKGKRFEFSQPTRVLDVNEYTSDVNFISND